MNKYNSRIYFKAYYKEIMVVYLIFLSIQLLLFINLINKINFKYMTFGLFVINLGYLFSIIAINIKKILINISNKIEQYLKQKPNLEIPDFKKIEFDNRKINLIVILFLVIFYTISYYCHFLFLNFVWASIGVLYIFYLIVVKYLIIDFFVKKLVFILQENNFIFNSFLCSNNPNRNPCLYMKFWGKTFVEGLILTIFLFLIGNYFLFFTQNGEWIAYIFIIIIYMITRRAVQIIKFLNIFTDDLLNQCEAMKQT